MAHGNYPVSKKNGMIRYWDVPSTSQSLHSFIGFIICYCKHTPYLEIRIISIRKLNKDYFKKPILTMTWTPTLLHHLNDAKIGITSSPILDKYGSSKPTFLDDDWNDEGMGWILM